MLPERESTFLSLAMKISSESLTPIYCFQILTYAKCQPQLCHTKMFHKAMQGRFHWKLSKELTVCHKDIITGPLTLLRCQRLAVGIAVILMKDCPRKWETVNGSGALTLSALCRTLKETINKHISQRIKAMIRFSDLWTSLTFRRENLVIT